MVLFPTKRALISESIILLKLYVWYGNPGVRYGLEDRPYIKFLIENSIVVQEVGFVRCFDASLCQYSMPFTMR